MSDLPEKAGVSQEAVVRQVEDETQEDQSPGGSSTGAGEEPLENYKVGPGKPPLHSRFKKGERSRNPDGRPVKVRPSLSSRQRVQDVARALTQPLRINGELKPFSIVNLELMKQAAIKGDGLAQRYLDKLDRTNRQEIMLQEAEIAREIATQYRNLAKGESPTKWVIGALNEQAECLEQLYLDPNHDPTKTHIKEQARSHRTRVRRMLREKAEMKAAGTWPPPGVRDMSDEEISE